MWREFPCSDLKTAICVGTYTTLSVKRDGIEEQHCKVFNQSSLSVLALKDLLGRPKWLLIVSKKIPWTLREEVETKNT